MDFDRIERRAAARRRAFQAADYLLLTLGALITAFAFAMFLLPNDIAPGGVTGIATVLSSWTGLNVGLLSFLINLPLFAIGWRRVGWRFAARSFVAMMLLSLFIDGLPVHDLAGDMMLASLFGGVIMGIGLGIVVRSGATTGGSDIAAKLLRRRFRSASLGKVLLAIDLFIIFLTGVVFRDISRTLYSALPLAVSSVVMDQLLYGLDHSTVALIISEHYQQVSKQIETRLDRGATVLDGSGSYTGQPRPVLMSAVRQRELPELKTIVREIDPDAFVILLPAHQVLGEGFRRAGDEL